jgi:hypothetical protein
MLLFIIAKSKNTIESISKEAEKLDWDILSKKYISLTSPLKFLCRKCNFIFERSLSNMRDSKYCPQCKQRIKRKNNIEKYGMSDVSHLSRQEKVKLFNQKKYGVYNVSQVKEIKIKKKQSAQDKYGVDNPFQSKQVRDKFKKTIQDKYGVDNPFQSEKIKNKSKKTCLEKYGVKNPSQSIKIKSQAMIKQKITNFKKVISRITEVEPLFDVDTYDGVENKKYEFHCKECNTDFRASIDNGKLPICRKCNPTRYTSKGELALLEYIKSIYSGIIIHQERKIIENTELDIYLPTEKIAIEYNGLYYHSELFGKERNYHLNKTEKCKRKGIFLIQIFEDEWIFKKNIVKQRLKHILNKDNDKIYARNCIVQKISYQDKKKFLEINHIQGNDTSFFNTGLFYKNELVALMTFSKPRIALGIINKNNGLYELSRFCMSKNIIGGAGKLLKYFERNINPKKLYSYADRRWSNGNLYLTLGFKLDSMTSPNYWYFNKNSIPMREHRFNYRKSKLLKEGYDENLTEWQIMQIKKYNRVWDCGNFKFIKFYK